MEQLKHDFASFDSVGHGGFQFDPCAFQQRVAQRRRIEVRVIHLHRKLSEDLRTEVLSNLAALINLAERPTNFSKLLVKQQKNRAFNCVRQDKIVNLCRVALTVAMDASDALLQVHRIPRQVEIEKYAGVLQVDALAACRCAD